MSKFIPTQRSLLFAWFVLFIAIVIASLMPEKLPGQGFISSRWWNWGHMPAYALLAGLSAMVAARMQRVTVWLLLAIGIGVGTLGLAIELIQPWFGRSLSLRDFIYNTIGIVAALAVCFILRDSVLFTAFAVKARQ